jgi:mono/diheme cytochrome c family protein
MTEGMRSAIFGYRAALCIASAGGALAIADAAATLSAQAAEGKTQFATRCASCHGSELGGGQHAPALTGPGFREHWDGKTARSVYSRIISTMPQDNPGSLSETEALTIALYVFAVNGIAVGDQPIPNAAALNGITIPKQVPAP